MEKKGCVDTEFTICPPRTGDDTGPTVARRTVAAEGVFEGRSEGFWALLESAAAAGRRTPLNVSFFVIKVHKGRTIPESRTVVVEVQGGGGEGNGSCSSRDSGEDVFVVFVRQVSPPVQEPYYYYLSDHIVPATEQVVRDVGDYACAKCGLPVKVHLPENVTIEEGTTLKLKCQTKGSPKPRIYWSKDGRPLVFDSRMKLLDRLGSTLQIKKIRQEDVGIYQCYASTAVANSSLASSKLIVTKAEYPASIHGELCEQQDYCMYNGKCYLLRPLGRKYCVCSEDFDGDRCESKRIRVPMVLYPTTGPSMKVSPVSMAALVCAKGFKGRQCILEDASVSVSRLEQPDDSFIGIEPVNRTFIVCVIVVGSVLLTTIIILTLCIVRLCQTKKKPHKENDEKCRRELLPVLPDGHQTIVNVNRLSAVLNQQSLSDFDGTHPSAFPGSKSLDGVREDEVTTTFGPVRAGWSGSRQSGSRPYVSNKEQGRANRLSTGSDEVFSQRQSWIGGNRLSATSDQLGFSNDRQRPVVRSNIGAARPSKIAATRIRCTTFLPATNTDFQPREAPRELAITGRTHYNHPLEDQATSTPAGTDASSETIGKDECRQSDMEVNCESEADIFGVESSGDELNNRARDASRELSEPSVRTDGNYSSMASDSDNSTLGGGNEDQTLVQRLSDYPFINANVFDASLNIRESGSDLSWDESADVPSFANPSLMYSGCI